MLHTKQEIFNTTIELTSTVVVLLIAIIIITAILYHNRKRNHKIDLSNFQSILLQAQLEVQEQTMQTIGADLHDNIGQLLSLTSLTLNSIELDNSERSQQKIESAIDLTKRSIKEMRLLGRLLQGDQLIALGLSEAIAQEVNWLERNGQYQISYIQENDPPAVNNRDKDLIMFRIIQELLNNIIKHAHATQITIKLDYRNDSFLLNISDNGIGFDVNYITANGMGLQNIHKRAMIVGGEVSITSGSGTSISVSIPYP